MTYSRWKFGGLEIDVVAMTRMRVGLNRFRSLAMDEAEFRTAPTNAIDQDEPIAAHNP